MNIALLPAATTSGAPGSGTWPKGAMVTTEDNHLWYCTVAGSPGTWVDGGVIGAAGVSTLAKNGSTGLTGDVTLTGGSNVTLTQSGNDISIASTGGGGGGTEYDYAQITSDVTVSGSSGAQTTVITGASVSYDGSTRVKIEVFSALWVAGSAALIAEVWEDSTSLGRVMQTGAALAFGGTGTVFRTPAAGAHTYTLKAWKNGGTDGSIGAVSGTFAPAYLRVTAA